MLAQLSIWLSNVFRLGLKELASLASDKVLFTFIIYSFSFSVYSVATGVKTEIENASIAVVDSDRSALSSRLREAFAPGCDGSRVPIECDHRSLRTYLFQNGGAVAAATESRVHVAAAGSKIESGQHFLQKHRRVHQHDRALTTTAFRVRVAAPRRSRRPSATARGCRSTTPRPTARTDCPDR